VAARIHILSDRLVGQIAAGEVVERPASVVKELVENSLDAGAANLEIELVAGGKRYIKVADDGEGMGADDALLAFDQHATSKIGSFEDLQAVGSFGFRGEALASIAAVARVELLTSEEGGAAHRVAVDGGRVRLSEPAARPRGTTLEVSSLFFNVPARRRFLKSPRTELRRCLEVLQGYALARPEVRLAVAHEGRSLLDLTAAGPDLEGVSERVRQIFGRGFAERLVEFRSEPSATGAIAGLVGTSEAARRRPFVFVNGRLLRDRAVLATFYRAVREEWRGEEFPPLFLFIEVPPADLDVNVHPQKAEVRFRSPAILELLSSSLRSALARGRREEPAYLREVPEGSLPPLAWRGLGETSPAGEGGDRREALNERPAAYAADGIAEAVYPPFSPRPVPLSGRGDRPRSLRLLGQYKGSLLLLEGPEGLYLIDQHAAHERILYERFRASLETGSPATQRLLEPLLLEVGPARALRLEELAERLARYGFHLGRLSGNSVGVHEVPAALTAAEAERLLLALADGEAAHEDEEIDSFAEELLVSLAASQACRSAVKIHHPLTREEMEHLLDDLFAARQPYSCPHGRPTVLQLSDAELERRFGRR
jgi:DNA mismatch repair protein MutL